MNHYFIKKTHLIQLIKKLLKKKIEMHFHQKLYCFNWGYIFVEKEKKKET